ncbi:hypothetical protein MMPV_002047 [Pyropia vietnamensis]
MLTSLLTSYPVPSLPPPGWDRDRAAKVAAIAASYPSSPSATIPGVTFVRPLPRAERPSLRWVLAVVATVARLGLNAAAVSGVTARRELGRFAATAATAAAIRVGAVVVALFTGCIRGGRIEEEAVGAAAARVDTTLVAGAGREGQAAHPPAGPRRLPGNGGRGRQIADGDAPDDPYAAYRALFVTLPLPAVASVAADDATWTRLRVAGPNPHALRSATADTAAAWGVTDTHLRSATGSGGDTLAAASEDHRLYAVDHVELGEFLAAGAVSAGSRQSRMSSSDGRNPPSTSVGGWGEVVHSPRALFVLPQGSATGTLVPVAIETGVAGGGPRSLVTPADGPRWAVARAALTAADGTDHQLTWHIGRTHLLVNVLAATARRSFSPRHPLLRLLGPHFAGTLSINNLADATLLPPGDAVDVLLPGSLAPMHAWAVRSLQKLDFWATAVPAELAARGVTDKRLAYPYRDDALRVWGALATFLNTFVDAWYVDDTAVAEDIELAAWASRVAAAGVSGFGEPRWAAVPTGSNDATGDIMTVPPLPQHDGATVRQTGGSDADPPAGADDTDQRASNGGKGLPSSTTVPIGFIRSREGLAHLLTVVVFTASAQHAAFNFPQATLSAYTPVAPLALMGDLPPPPPEGHSPPFSSSQAAAAATKAAAAAAVAAVLPPPLTAARQAFVYTLLGSVRVSRLGAYPWAPWRGGWFRHEGVAAAAARLRARLAEVDAEVRAREAGEVLPYLYLAPSNIPMSVDI